MMQQPSPLQKVVVLNPKGGSGKSTVATNLAAYYAWKGLRVALMDMDPQGSSIRWLKVRPGELPPIHPIAAYEQRMGVTRSFALRAPPGTERLIVKVHRSEKRLVIVANRARRYTKAYQSLMRFLQTMRIPVAAVLRDSQAYVRSAETGMGLHEMKGALLQDDLDTFRPLVEWLERRSFSLVPTDETASAGPADAAADSLSASA